MRLIFRIPRKGSVFVMKKLRKALLVTLVLLACVFVLPLLTSCEQITVGGSQKPITIDEVFTKHENTDYSNQKIETVYYISGTPVAISGDVLICEKEQSTINVYNLATETLISRVSGSEQVGFIGSYERASSIPDSSATTCAGIFYVISGSEENRKISIYSSDGKEALSVPYSEEDFELVTEDNAFSVNGTAYYVKDGQVLVEGYNPLESEYFSKSTEYHGCYYYLSEDRVFVFNGNGEIRYEYIVPSYASEANIFVLENGNVFVQYVYEVIEGEEYDYIKGAKKYKIVSILANIMQMTETMPSLDYIVNSIYNSYTTENFRDMFTVRVSNIARITEIKNNRIDTNEPSKYISLSDNLIELFSYFDIVNGALNISRVSNDRYLVSTATGNILVSGSSVVIGQVNNYKCITEKYILSGGRIYDHDLVMIYDLTIDGFTFYDTVGDNIILSKLVDEKTVYYLFDGNGTTEICSSESFSLGIEGYSVKNDDGSYSYYNEIGKFIAKTDGYVNWIYSNEGKKYIGISYDSDGDRVFYSLTFDFSVDINHNAGLED